MDLNNEVPQPTSHHNEMLGKEKLFEPKETPADTPVATDDLKDAEGHVVSDERDGKEAFKPKETPADTPVATDDVKDAEGHVVSDERDGKEAFEPKESGFSPSESLHEALVQKERELAEADRRAIEVEAQLQLYSEVLSLRKELLISQGDRERINGQLAVLNDVVAEDNDSTGHEIALFEEEAGLSNVQRVWTDVCRQNPVDMHDDSTFLCKIRIEDISERLRNARERFHEATATAAQVYREQEERAKEERLKQPKLCTPEELREELARLADVKERLKQTDSDQLYHIRRGTYVKDSVVSMMKRGDATQHRVYTDEFKQCGDVHELEIQVQELMEKVRSGKRELEDNKRSYAKVQMELKEQLCEAEKNGKEAREMRSYFEKEQARLKELKVNIQRVLNYVRVRNRKVIT